MTARGESKNDEQRANTAEAALARLQRTVDFMESEYLAGHGGSWGECKYQHIAKDLQARLAALERVREAALPLLGYIADIRTGTVKRMDRDVVLSLTEAIEAAIARCPQPATERQSVEPPRAVPEPEGEKR